MNSEGMEKQVKTLKETVRKLEARVQKTEDIEAVKKLQDAYGYYLEHWQEEELIDLFSHSENVAVEINDFGLFKGWEAIKSCYRFEDHYPNYPGLKKAPGEYLHILIPMAGIVDVSQDGKTAKGRWYGYFLTPRGGTSLVDRLRYLGERLYQGRWHLENSENLLERYHQQPPG